MWCHSKTIEWYHISTGYDGTTIPHRMMGATLDASYEYRPQVSPAADRGHKPPQQWPITGPQQPSINVSIMHRGYKCCSLNLEDAMNAAYNELSQKPDFNDCNIDLIAKVIQRAAQEKFGMSFETIVALNDFAGKSAYEGNLTCKFKLHGKYIHSYATPVQYDVRERVIEQAFSNADVTHNIIVGPSTEGVDEEEKQRRIDELNRLGLGGSRKTRSISQLSSVNSIKFTKVNYTTMGANAMYELTMGDPSMYVGVARRRLYSTC
ncbi:hypothetical protein Tcan_11719 [Toxocara canis]|uniref:Ground-like domain-containing protein n=1 Tax=Toxocara canis TaxID=6265 RepID=A0A0B2UVP0_TOXCA|nr:hypothetical protein Tcan_11719 [Toxocara canis]